MSAVKNIWADLVEKRLWPVAALLLVALVGVPVVIASRSSSEEPAPTTAPAAAVPAASLPAGVTPAQAQAAQVSLDTTLEAKARHRQGKVRDPFKQLRAAVKTATTSTTAATATPAPSTPVTSGGGGAPATVTPSPSTPVTTSPSKPSSKPNPLDLYRVSIRFGRAGALRTRKDIARLTPLPSSTYPFFVYLGVLADKKTSVFLISSDVKATGDGTCRPSKDACQTIELREGDTEFFDYSPSGDDSDVTQFQMDVLSVHKKAAATAASAKAARVKVDRKGRAVVRAATSVNLLPQINGYRYSKATGLLSRNTDKKHRVAAASKAPSAIVRHTKWGVIAKVQGAVVFAAKKAKKTAQP